MKPKSCCENGSTLFELTKEMVKDIGQLEYLHLCHNSIYFRSFRNVGS